MKNLSLCLFVLALSAVGCESKPPAKTAPVVPNAATMAGHAGMATPGAGEAAPAEKKEGEAAAPAEGEKKEGEAAAPAEGEKKEGEAAAPAEGEKKE